MSMGLGVVLAAHGDEVPWLVGTELRAIDHVVEMQGIRGLTPAAASSVAVEHEPTQQRVEVIMPAWAVGAGWLRGSVEPTPFGLAVLGRLDGIDHAACVAEALDTAADCFLLLDVGTATAAPDLGHAWASTL
jgi:hypothetical protein